MENRRIFSIGIVILVVILLFWVTQNMTPPEEEPLPPEEQGEGDGEPVTVDLYFNNSEEDPEGLYCDQVYLVTRDISETQAVARATIEELLKGPTLSEEEQGFFTSINPGTKVQSVNIKNGIVTADFDETLEYQVGGSCRVAAIRAQIEETLLQFPSIDEVVISVNGRTEDVLQP
jgi:spore germination protein GerM